MNNNSKKIVKVKTKSNQIKSLSLSAITIYTKTKEKRLLQKIVLMTKRKKEKLKTKANQCCICAFVVRSCHALVTFYKTSANKTKRTKYLTLLYPVCKNTERYHIQQNKTEKKKKDEHWNDEMSNLNKRYPNSKNNFFPVEI